MFAASHPRIFGVNSIATHQIEMLISTFVMICILHSSCLKEVPMSESTPTSVPQPDPAVRKEELRLAMKAFRKRLKLTRLDDESRIGHGPMSGGGKSGVVAITPPSQFPKDVWEELTEQGKLKRAGRGIYELVDP